MLYYYQTKRKPRLWTKKWFVALSLTIIVWAYYYLGSFANVAHVLPKLEDQVLPGFHTNIEPTASKTKPKVLKADDADEGMSLAEMRAAKLDFERDSKEREAKELAFSLNLLARLDGDDSVSKKRAKIIRQDIVKTIGYFKAGNTTSASAHILGNYDGGHLAYVYYPNYGVHFNPVTTSNKAIDHYEKGRKEELVKIADALIDTAILKSYPDVGAYYIWENYFDLEFGSLKFAAPWNSGMAQGLVLDVIGKAYKTTSDRKYLEAGDLVLNSFKIPWDKGGVTQTDEHGNWYLEVAATDRIRILNGFLFTLTSMNSYYEITRSKKVEKLFNVGVTEAAAHLQEYDLGYWSNYSLVVGNKANYGYHKIHVDLLKRLYNTSKIPALKTYADKFDFYLKNRFIDIPPTHPSFAAIASLTEHGVIKSNDGWFGARNDISRAEFIRYLVLMKGWKRATLYRGYYNDVRRDHEDWSYIEAAYEHGVKLGDDQGYFSPSDPLSRAEIASALCAAYSAKAERGPIAANDIAGISHEESIRIAVSNGLIDLYQTNYFRPDVKVNREQAANILFKLSGYPGSRSTSPANIPNKGAATSH